MPMGDSGGALLAGIGCVVERLGVGAAIPSGYTASSASVAAPGWHHAQPSGKYHALVCRRAQRHAMDRAVTGAIRAAASNDLHGAQRHRVYLVGQGAAHVSVGASRQVGRVHGPDRTQERDRQGRDVHHRSIRAHRGHCARARSPSLHGLPPSLIPPALFPCATRRVKSGLAALPRLGYSSSRATAGGGAGLRTSPGVRERAPAARGLIRRRGTPPRAVLFELEGKLGLFQKVPRVLARACRLRGVA